MKKTRTKKKTKTTTDHLVEAATRMVDNFDPKMDAANKTSLHIALLSYQSMPIHRLFAAAIRMADETNPKMDAVRKLALHSAVRAYQESKRTKRIKAKR